KSKGGGMSARARGLALLLAVAAVSGGCYTRRMQRMEESLTSLHVQVDSASTVNATALAQVKKDLADQRETLLSMKAGTNVASKELVDRLEEVSAKLDDIVDRMSGIRGSGVMPSTRVPGDTTRVLPQVTGGDAE